VFVKNVEIKYETTADRLVLLFGEELSAMRGVCDGNPAASTFGKPGLEKFIITEPSFTAFQTGVLILPFSRPGV
jgi:hypothetical protein